MFQVRIWPIYQLLTKVCSTSVTHGVYNGVRTAHVSGTGSIGLVIFSQKVLIDAGPHRRTPASVWLFPAGLDRLLHGLVRFGTLLSMLTRLQPVYGVVLSRRSWSVRVNKQGLATVWYSLAKLYRMAPIR